METHYLDCSRARRVTRGPRRGHAPRGCLTAVKWCGRVARSLFFSFFVGALSLFIFVFFATHHATALAPLSRRGTTSAAAVAPAPPSLNVDHPSRRHHHCHRQPARTSTLRRRPGCPVPLVSYARTAELGKIIHGGRAE